MGDKETGSEWSHILGTAQAGPLKGQQLTIVPSSMTDWKSWLHQHPDTTVTMIERSAAGFETSMLLRPKKFGIGLVHSGNSRLWLYDDLRKNAVVNDQLDELALVVHFDANSSTPHIWNRETDKGALRFDSGPKGVTDIVTGSTWNLQTGLATEGELKGIRLRALPGVVTFRSAWMRFHTDSTVWSAAK